VPRRIACIALSDIRVEIAGELERARKNPPPLAVIVARPGSPVQTERNILGNTRLDCVSREAAALGVRAGQTVAAARAKLAGLRVRVVAMGAVHAALARIAEAALAFGPTSAFDVTRDVVWVDVTGCAHFYGSESAESALATALGARVRGLGHACCVAVADGPRLAAAVARFSGSRHTIVAEGRGAAAVRALPITALELDADVTTWLADLGLFVCGDLQKIPRRALGMRLGARVHDVMQLLDGRDPAPLDPWRPPEVPEERIELEWGAGSIEALTFVLKTLCDRLATRLHGRALAAARLELVLSLDRALCDAAGPACEHRPSLTMVLPSPMARAGDLLAVVRARLEGCTLAAPVLAVTLRAPELARSPGRPLDLLEPEPRALGALPLLVAELAAELGEGVVGTLALVDTWSPAERTRLVPLERFETSARHAGPAGPPAPAAANVSAPGGHPLETSALEPSRLVASFSSSSSSGSSSHVPRDALDGARLLARVEANAWWQRPAGFGRDAAPVVLHDRPWRHDLFAAWFDGAIAWLELRLPGEELVLRGWMD
jgi:protein ImuB